MELLTANGTFAANFAAGSKQLAIAASAGGAIAYGLGTANPISARATYVGAFAAAGSDATVPAINLSFGAITSGGLATGDYIERLGFTYLGRTNGGGLTNATQATVTVTFTNLTTSISSTVVFGTNANNAGGERFFGVVAPAGNAITGLTIDTGVTHRRVFIDDLGFVTAAIPEPSAFAALAGLGALGFVASRRRRRG